MRGWLVLAALVCAGCGSEPHSGAQASRGENSGASSTQADIVAQVGPNAVTVSDVSALVEAVGLPPREAAERLVRERLLAEEAERRGYASDPEVLRAVRNAAAHALVGERVEATWTDETLPEDRVDEACERALRAASKPEQRRADHVLFALPQDAPPVQVERGRRAAEKVTAALSEADDVEAALVRYEKAGTVDGVPLKVERLPSAPRTGVLEAPFSEALFALAEGGVSGPVRTRSGWHAIVLKEIIPEKRVTRTEVEAQVRERLVLKIRREALDALLVDLGARLAPEYDEANIERAFAVDVGLP